MFQAPARESGSRSGSGFRSGFEVLAGTPRITSPGDGHFLLSASEKWYEICFGEPGVLQPSYFLGFGWRAWRWSFLIRLSYKKNNKTCFGEPGPFRPHFRGVASVPGDGHFVNMLETSVTKQCFGGHALQASILKFDKRAWRWSFLIKLS